MKDDLYHPTVHTFSGKGREHDCAGDVDFWCRECLPPMNGRTMKGYLDEELFQESAYARVMVHCAECNTPVTFFAETEAVIFVNVSKVICGDCLD